VCSGQVCRGAPFRGLILDIWGMPHPGNEVSEAMSNPEPLEHLRNLIRLEKI